MDIGSAMPERHGIAAAVTHLHYIYRQPRNLLSHDPCTPQTPHTRIITTKRSPLPRPPRTPPIDTTSLETASQRPSIQHAQIATLLAQPDGAPRAAPIVP